VCLEHRGVVALAAWAKQFYTPAEMQGVLFATPATFDVSVFESLVPLCLGGKIIMAENILELPGLAAADEVRLISGVPSAVAELIRTHRLPPTVITVNVAGEPCPQSVVESLYQFPHIGRVIDVYGPTETTVYSTGGLRRPGGRATIGRPLPNEQAYVLDRQQQPVPIGVRGELHIGGEKLARGYLNRPELTREKFVELPFQPGTRVYRTGDAARFLADGTIEYLGRIDPQVKIRGYRIELGEVEAAMAQHPMVAESVAVARPDPAGTGHRLIAYVVRVRGAAGTSHDLRSHLLQRLPDYMVPSGIVLLDALPRTTSGKVDHRALPEPAFGSEQSAHVAPRSTTEQLLVEIWCDVLGLKQVSIHDNFFELGGHSILAMQVIARIHDSLGVDLGMRQFFVAPTVARMAPLIEAALIEDITAAMGGDEVSRSASPVAVAKE
jgi:acyl-coenzyme A synthetase/AMP-(fatty) acid ligase